MSASGVIAGSIVLIGLGVLWYLVPFAMRRRAERQLAERCRSRRAIVLTFDDGPGEMLTPQLLDMLQDSGVKATFYALGKNVRRCPHILDRILRDGHHVGSHTFDHSNAWKTTPWRAARDLRAGIELIGEAGGSRQDFRPPYGKLTIAGLVHGTILGLRYGWWTVDTRDSWAPRPVDDVVREVDAKGGGVILMHDFDRYDKIPPTPTHAEHVLDLTRRLLALARERGYRVVPLSSLDGLPPASAP